MTTDPYLWRNLDGSVVVSHLVPLTTKNNFRFDHRPATAEDIETIPFLKPEHKTEPETEDPFFE